MERTIQEHRQQSLIHYWHSRPSLSQRLAGFFPFTKLEELPGSLQFASKHPMFSRLKCLSISLSSIPDFCFDRFINPHFGQLERLEACALILKTKNCLYLPHLKTLSLHFLRIDIKPIELQLPSLRQFLSNESVVSFRFAHPQLLTHLLTRNDQSIGQFVHLKHLSCYNFTNHARNTLLNFPELEMIYYGSNFTDSFGRGGFSDFSQTLKDLGRLDDFCLCDCSPSDYSACKKKIWLRMWAYLLSQLSEFDFSFLRLALARS